MPGAKKKSSKTKKDIKIDRSRKGSREEKKAGKRWSSKSRRE